MQHGDVRAVNVNVPGQLVLVILGAVTKHLHPEIGMRTTKLPKLQVAQIL